MPIRARSLCQRTQSTVTSTNVVFLFLTISPLGHRVGHGVGHSVGHRIDQARQGKYHKRDLCHLDLTRLHALALVARPTVILKLHITKVNIVGGDVSVRLQLATDGETFTRERNGET